MASVTLDWGDWDEEEEVLSEDVLVAWPGTDATLRTAGEMGIREWRASWLPAQATLSRFNFF